MVRYCGFFMLPSYKFSVLTSCAKKLVGCTVLYVSIAVHRELRSETSRSQKRDWCLQLQDVCLWGVHSPAYRFWTWHAFLHGTTDIVPLLPFSFASLLVQSKAAYEAQDLGFTQGELGLWELLPPVRCPGLPGTDPPQVIAFSP